MPNRHLMTESREIWDILESFGKEFWILRLEKILQISYEQDSYLFHFLNGGISNMIFEWLKNDCKDSTLEMRDSIICHIDKHITTTWGNHYERWADSDWYKNRYKENLWHFYGFTHSLCSRSTCCRDHRTFLRIQQRWLNPVLILPSVYSSWSIGYIFNQIKREKKYIKRHWIGLIASIPFTQILRPLRFIRLVRIVRSYAFSTDWEDHLPFSDFCSITDPDLLYPYICFSPRWSTHIVLLDSIISKKDLTTALRESRCSVDELYYIDIGRLWRYLSDDRRGQNYGGNPCPHGNGPVFSLNGWIRISHTFIYKKRIEDFENG